MTYPTDLPNLTNPTAADYQDSATVPHATQHANANDLIEALAAKVGVDSSAVTTSLDYKVRQALTRYGYATGTLTLAVQPTAGDTITLGNLTYTYVASSSGPNEITIDATLSQTQTNTLLMVNAGIGATVPVIGLLPFSSNISTAVAVAVGTAGNGLATTSIFTSGSNHFGATTLSGGTDGTSTEHVQAQTGKFTGSSPAGDVLQVQSAPGTVTTSVTNIFVIRDSNGNLVAQFDSAGNFYTFGEVRMQTPAYEYIFVVSAAGKQSYRIPDAADAAVWRVQSSPEQDVFKIRPGSDRTIEIDAMTGSVGLQIWCNFVDETDLAQFYGTTSGVLVGRVLNRGAYVTAQHTAPADADLNTGEMAIWFDQTNGASKLMIKGKSANGTVVTGNVALA